VTQRAPHGGGRWRIAAESCWASVRQWARTAAVKARQLVAAFQQRNHAALGILIGDVQQDPRQLLEIPRPSAAARPADRPAANRSRRK